MPTRSTTGGPIFLEYTVGTAFACTCKIPSHPNPFGSESKPLFTTKKAARSNAAKEAMQFLIAHGLARSDGNCKKKESKRAKLDAAVAMAEDTEATFARKVNGMFYFFVVKYLYLSPRPHKIVLSSNFFFGGGGDWIK